jgi:uncharacterized protein
MNISGSRVVITGAASGIGRALLAECVRRGARVVASDVDAGKLHDAVLSVGAGSGYVCDVSDPVQIDGLFDHAIQTLGGIDLFFANAGFAYFETDLPPDWSRIEAIYRVNVFAPIYITEKMHTLYTQSGSQSSYRVVITASTMAHFALAGYAIYAGTKAALHRFAEGFRHGLPRREMLTLAYPIATRTGFFRRSTDPSKPPAYVPFPSQTPEYVAAAIMRGIERDRADIYTSLVYRLFAISERIIPPMRRVLFAIEGYRLARWLKSL